MIVMPVIVRRRETGELVQRFVFPTTDRRFELSRPIRNGGLVATTIGLWGLGSKEASSARSVRPGALAVLESGAAGRMAPVPGMIAVFT